VPFNAPSFALSKPVVRLFNKLYFGRVPKSGRISVEPISDFFFPLDAIHNWNRLYGKRGFHQFQCVLPIEQADALREMLVGIARSDIASPLAMLKRMGAGRAGYLSFPMDGYTLATGCRLRGLWRTELRGYGVAWSWLCGGCWFGRRGSRGIGNYEYGAAKARFATYLTGLQKRLTRTGGHVVTVKPSFSIPA